MGFFNKKKKESNTADNTANLPDAKSTQASNSTSLFTDQERVSSGVEFGLDNFSDSAPPSSSSSEVSLATHATSDNESVSPSEGPSALDMPDLAHLTDPIKPADEASATTPTLDGDFSINIPDLEGFTSPAESTPETATASLMEGDFSINIPDLDNLASPAEPAPEIAETPVMDDDFSINVHDLDNLASPAEPAPEIAETPVMDDDFGINTLDLEGFASPAEPAPEATETPVMDDDFGINTLDLEGFASPAEPAPEATETPVMDDDFGINTLDLEGFASPAEPAPETPETPAMDDDFSINIPDLEGFASPAEPAPETPETPAMDDDFSINIPDLEGFTSSPEPTPETPISPVMDDDFEMEESNVIDLTPVAGSTPLEITDISTPHIQTHSIETLPSVEMESPSFQNALNELYGEPTPAQDLEPNPQTEETLLNLTQELYPEEPPQDPLTGMPLPQTPQEVPILGFPEPEVSTENLSEFNLNPPEPSETLPTEEVLALDQDIQSLEQANKRLEQSLESPEASLAGSEKPVNISNEETFKILHLCNINETSRLFVVEMEDIFALMGEMGPPESENVEVLKVFNQNPLTPEETTFQATPENTPSGEERYQVQVGTWKGVISKDNEILTLHTEINAS